MPEPIKARCESCGEDSTFTYVGTQKDIAGKPLFDLYTCGHCHSSVVLDLDDKTLEGKAEETD